jgi:hypothetical protein
MPSNTQRDLVDELHNLGRVYEGRDESHWVITHDQCEDFVQRCIAAGAVTPTADNCKPTGEARR